MAKVTCIIVFLNAEGPFGVYALPHAASQHGVLWAYWEGWKDGRWALEWLGSSSVVVAAELSMRSRTR